MVGQVKRSTLFYNFISFLFPLFFIIFFARNAEKRRNFPWFMVTVTRLFGSSSLEGIKNDIKIHFAHTSHINYFPTCQWRRTAHIRSCFIPSWCSATRDHNKFSVIFSLVRCCFPTRNMVNIVEFYDDDFFLLVEDKHEREKKKTRVCRISNRQPEKWRTF